ncbi:MAG: hypothetical protein J5535_04170 [Firmicutes bacterium]|nr:hypothetical protein [Bacillota bacterium]
MEGFTLALALVDAIPVLLFGASMIMIAARAGSVLFVIGAVLSTLAGCFKVLWKIILATQKKSVKWLNKGFLPLMGAGWLLILLSLILMRSGGADTAWAAGLIRMPSVLFLALWLVLMGFMVWYRKKRFVNEDAKKNWTAQIINCVAMASLFAGILLAR